jgi:cyclopropane fatty-acyl-phospholipid synthase-like methyltransferase
VSTTPRILRASSAAQAKRLIRRLPAPRDQAALAVLRDLRALATGRAPAPKPVRPRPSSTPPKPSSRRAKPAASGPARVPPLVRPPALPEGAERVPFPPMEAAGELVRSLYETGGRPERFDIELLEQLNAEYADRRVVRAPRSFLPAAMQEAARARVAWAQTYVDLRDTSVLEIGCGQGYEAYVVANDYGSSIHGVDVNEYTTWAQLASDRVSFTCGDMTQDNPFARESFDRVVSYTVWEHVVHPRRLLRETFSVLKPGGLALIRANLYAGTMASHRYREIYFPWPHLLFSDDVIRDWDAKHGRETRGSEWVNRLTWNHYERYIAEAGFRLLHRGFAESEWDEAFYRRFEDVLGRFPAEDLKRNFFNVVLEKPA